MAGSNTGVSTQINAESKGLALFTQCYGHSLSLALKDVFKKMENLVLSNSLDFAHEITKLIKFSPKRQAIFDKLKETCADVQGVPGIRTMCPTRWTVKGTSCKSILDNYNILARAWEICLSEPIDSETKARILGVNVTMQSFDFFFGLHLSCKIFMLSDNLSATLQQTKLCASDSRRIAMLTVETFKKMRTDESFALWWETVSKLAEDTGIVKEPTLPRKRKAPKRFEEGSSDTYHFYNSPLEYYRSVYFHAVDTVIQTIQQRLDQPGKNQLEMLEKVILSDEPTQSNLALLKSKYSVDINSDLLNASFCYSDK